eukprot:GHRR01024015.1.p1 GENE.GHRR01024015.1~~GHRR01024015.1.p1  ORF type:complete len:617 (+),score=164.97 GHRR01024015.1:919-2769(+)
MCFTGIKTWMERTRDRGSKAFKEYTVFDWFALFLPCLKWLQTYSIREYLVWDLLAGISVGFMIVPQGMSYANVAGVPSVYGLYGSFLPLLVYALLGSSRQLGVGPVAVTSLLIGNGIRDMIPGSELIDNPNAPSPEHAALQELYNHKVIQIAFIVACMYTGVGLLRLGFIVRFLSHSVITGFTSGAAIIIGMSQVRYILGYKVPRVDTLYEQIEVLIEARAGFKWQECVMGISMLLFLLGLRTTSRQVKKLHWIGALGPILACVISIVAVAIGKLNKRGIKIVEQIPQGLPPPTIGWWAPVSNTGAMIGLGAVVMLVDLLESTSIARALARKHGYELSYNQEIVGLGIANFAGAMFNSYTTTGSFSRSAVNNSSGAKTQLAGFITSMVVMFVLLFVTKVFELLPYNTMAAIIIAGVTSLVEFGTAAYLFKTHLRDFLVWCVAFFATLFLGIELGLAAAIGLALLIVIFESAFPHTAVLGRVDKTTVSIIAQSTADCQYYCLPYQTVNAAAHIELPEHVCIVVLLHLKALTDSVRLCSPVTYSSSVSKVCSNFCLACRCTAMLSSIPMQRWCPVCWWFVWMLPSTLLMCNGWRISFWLMKLMPTGQASITLTLPDNL